MSLTEMITQSKTQNTIAIMKNVTKVDIDSRRILKESWRQEPHSLYIMSFFMRATTSAGPQPKIYK